MSTYDQVSKWLLLTVQLMVDKQNQVNVELIETEGHVSFKVHLHPSDVGKLIGTQGRNARSIRVLARAIAKKLGIPPFGVDLSNGSAP